MALLDNFDSKPAEKLVEALKLAQFVGEGGGFNVIYYIKLGRFEQNESGSKMSFEQKVGRFGDVIT